MDIDFDLANDLDSPPIDKKTSQSYKKLNDFMNSDGFFDKISAKPNISKEELFSMLLIYSLEGNKSVESTVNHFKMINF